MYVYKYTIVSESHAIRWSEETNDSQKKGSIRDNNFPFVKILEKLVDAK